MSDSMMLRLSAKQVEFKTKILDDPTVVEALIGGSAGGGKTMSMCIAMMIAIATYPGIQLALGRKTLQGLNRSTVATLLGKVHPMFHIGASDFHFDKKDGIITYHDGSKITLLALDYEPSDPDFARLGSAEFDWAFVDEAGEISKQAKDVLRSRLGRGIATQKFDIPPKIILSCNPSTNFLRTEYYQPYHDLGAGGFQKWRIGDVIVKGARKPAYRAFLRMSVKDNSFIDKNYYETLKQLPERERKRLLDGNWDYADNDRMLFTGELIDDCTIREKPEMGVIEKNDYLIGVDVADVGTDSSVISVVQNNILIRQIKISLRESGIGKDSKVDIGDFLSEKVIFCAKHYGLSERDAKRITIETNGVGASLRDALRRKKWFVTEYTADARSRGRMFYSLHELLVDGKAFIFDNPDLNYSELRRQMTAHEYELENDKVKLSSKKELRRQLGCSPDMADSFAIAMYPRGDAIVRTEPKRINYFTKIKI